MVRAVYFESRGSFLVNSLAAEMSGSGDRRHPEVEEFGLERWPLLSSSSAAAAAAAAAAVCYEPGCVLSMPDQLRSATDRKDATTSSMPLWFNGPAFTDDEAFFKASDNFADRHFYDQQLATPVSEYPLSTAVQPPQPSAICYDFTPLGQHSYDRFPSNNCEYFNLQPFQHGPGYPWFSSSSGDAFAQQMPVSQCVGFSGCPPTSAYGRGPEVPYSPSAWVHVKSERRSSSSATSSSVDCATKLVQTSPFYCDDPQLKQETLVSGSVERSYDEFSVSADVDKDDWSAGRCMSDASPSSVDQLSDAVCHVQGLRRCGEITILQQEALLSQRGRVMLCVCQ